MRFSIFIFFIIVGLLVSSCSKHSNELVDNLPNNQWLVINYWATWCKPCIEEIPELNKLAASQAGTITVLGVDFDQSQGPALQTKIDQLGITFTVLTSDPAVAMNYQRPTVLPTTVIINPQQQWHKTLIGPQTEQSILQAINP